MNKLMRKKYLNTITSKLGQVVVTNDEIICYVDKEKLNSFKSELCYDLRLSGAQKLSRSILDKYDLNKPVHYIIDGIYFDNGLCLNSDMNVHVEFKNCIFGNKLHIKEADLVTLNNNKYNPRDFLIGGCVFDCSAKKLKIEKERFIDFKYLREGSKRFGMNIAVENLEILDSSILITKDEGSIEIIADKIDIKDTSINCHNTVSIKSNMLNLDNSRVESKTKIVLYDQSSNNNNNIIMGIKAPKIIYNGIDITKKEEPKLNKNQLLTILATQLKTIEINKTNQERRRLRKNLIYELRSLRNKTQSINEEKILKLKQELDNEIIDKIIKK